MNPNSMKVMITGSPKHIFLRIIIIFLSSIWSKIVGKYIVWNFRITINEIVKIQPHAETCPIPEKYLRLHKLFINSRQML